MRRLLTTAAVVAAALLAGCGADGGSAAKQAARPTATPPPEAPGPAGLDVKAVNSARDAFVEACNKREAGGGGAELTDARRAAKTLLAALDANPDEAFRRSAEAPAATMRDRVRALALVARTRCGDGAAAKLGDRLARAAASDSS